MNNFGFESAGGGGATPTTTYRTNMSEACNGAIGQVVTYSSPLVGAVMPIIDDYQGNGIEVTAFDDNGFTINSILAGNFGYLDIIEGGGGPAPSPAPLMIQISMSDLIDKRDNSQLVPGAFYLTDDADRGGKGLIFQALKVNVISNQGIRLMLCPADYVIETDIHGNNWLGVWNSGLTPSADDLTIWGGKVWKNLTGAVGTATDNITLDAVNWVLIPKNTFTNHEYVELVFGIVYEWFEDGGHVAVQWDAKGNRISFLKGYFFVTCDGTDWNMPGLADNDCMGIFNNIASSIHDNKNVGIIYNNIVTEEIFNNSDIDNISSNHVSTFISDNSKGIITGNNVDSIYHNTFCNIINNSNSGVISSNSNTGDIFDNTNAGDISNNSNAGDISSNSNNDTIENNSNLGHISDNSNQGQISLNCNNGAIFNNHSNVTEITVNSNNAEIANNDNMGIIGGNSNNGGIYNNTSVVGCNIANNINNGHITGAQIADVTDPIVNK